MVGTWNFRDCNIIVSGSIHRATINVLQSTCHTSALLLHYRATVLTVTDRRWTNCVLLFERYFWLSLRNGLRGPHERVLINVRTTNTKNECRMNCGIINLFTLNNVSIHWIGWIACLHCAWRVRVSFKKVSKSERAILLPMTRAIFLGLSAVLNFFFGRTFRRQ